jgi:hypothetical protein
MFGRKVALCGAAASFGALCRSKADDQSPTHEEVMAFQAEKVDLNSVKSSVLKKRNLKMGDIRAFRKAENDERSTSLCGSYIIQQFILDVLQRHDPHFFEAHVDKHLDDWYHFQGVLCYEGNYEQWLNLNELDKKPNLDKSGLKQLQALPNDAHLPEYIHMEDTGHVIDEFKAQRRIYVANRKKSQ